MTFFILFLGLLFGSSILGQETQKVVKLVGYKILATKASTQNTANVEACLEACITNSANCIGIQFLETSCIQFTAIRNIIADATVCGYYIIDKRNDSVEVGSLTEIEKLVYFSAYLSGSSCPQKTTDRSSKCTITLNTTICQEYAPFFKAYSGGQGCTMIPTNRDIGFCYPGIGRKTLKFVPVDIEYCYYRIGINATVKLSIEQDVSVSSSICLSYLPESYILTICNQVEYDFITTNYGQTMIGLYCPNDKPITEQCFEWIDGVTTCAFRDWLAGSPLLNHYSANEERFMRIKDFGEAEGGYKWDNFEIWDYYWVDCKHTALTLDEIYQFCKSTNSTAC